MQNMMMYMTTCYISELLLGNWKYGIYHNLIIQFYCLEKYGWLKFPQVQQTGRY
uniref:Acyl-coenzyme A oxidase 4 n=1 Tax=Rhizophora mucronata TaxID=61149 RepID=A0A2P2JNH5_RHIMU